MKKKILIAEDDSDILLVLQMILTNAGYDVEVVQDGNAIVTGRKTWPDLFILDKDIPSVDGIALCKFLKLKEETKDIPIIMMTCFHHLKNRAAKAGAAEFIEKPFEVQHLLDTVDKYTNRNEPVAV
jgi:DNA-binding response OmpR family regulator